MTENNGELLKAIERFDEAALDWGWQRDMGTYGVDASMAEYDSAKDELLTLANRAVQAERAKHEWQDVSTCPHNGEFLAYGSYLYPGDKSITEYMAVATYSGDPEWPIETHDGKAIAGQFSHWRPLPPAPNQSGGDQ